MASRTSGSIGLMAALVISIIFAFGFFLAWVFAFANANALQAKVTDAESTINELVRNDTRAAELRRDAGNTGVVDYLDQTLSEVFGKVTGNANETPESFTRKLEAQLGEDNEGKSLFSFINDQQLSIERLQSNLSDTERRANTLRSDLAVAQETLQTVSDEQAQTIAELTAEVESYRAKTDGYADAIGDAINKATGQVDKATREFEAQLSVLEAELRERDVQIAQFEQQLSLLKGDSDPSITGREEASLRDGTVLSVDIRSDEAYIDLGRGDQVVLGMTFEVYDNALTAPELDRDGTELPGKATIEIIRVIDQTKSLVRIIRATPGQPLLQGDWLANALYDPAKTYKAMVIGNFDTNADGRASAREASQIEAVIAEWGGVTTSELSGDVDFIVMGSKPILPPQPAAGSPTELIIRWGNLRTQVQRYEDIIERAAKVGIPVLNQNRLFTLTGIDRRL